MTRVFDIVGQKVFWEGKNVPADDLQLKVPMIDLDCCFSDNSNILTTSTAFGKVTASDQIRQYDFRVDKRRPLKDVAVDKFPLGKVLVKESNNNIYLGADSGEVFVLDPRNNFQVIKKLHDGHGTITDMRFSADQKSLATTSLDRHLRIYSLDTHELLREEFMYQKLERCAFSSQPFDFEADDIERLDDSQEELQDEEAAPSGPKAAPVLFRDKVAKIGGSLNHNLIKLKYEKRIKKQ